MESKITKGQHNFKYRGEIRDDNGELLYLVESDNLFDVIHEMKEERQKQLENSAYERVWKRLENNLFFGRIH